MHAILWSRRHSHHHYLHHRRIASGLLQVTSKFYPCQIRFYYYFAASKEGRFNVKLRECAGRGCNETIVWSENEDRWSDWARQTVTLNSTKPFQVNLIYQACQFEASDPSRSPWRSIRSNLNIILTKEKRCIKA